MMENGTVLVKILGAIDCVVLRMYKAERLHKEKVFESFLLMAGRCIRAAHGLRSA